METAVTFEPDFEPVRVLPTINDRVMKMKLKQAEERADRNMQIALAATQENATLRGELLCLARANQALLLRIHKLTAGNRCFALPGVNA